MTAKQRKDATRYLQAFDFSGLFTDPAIGWDWPGSGRPLQVPVGDEFIALEPIAEKRGVRILHVPHQADGTIMPSESRKKLEKAVTPLAAEHLLIFTDKAKTRQVWLWTSRLPGKPVCHRELTWEKGRTNELLLQKITTIAFTLDEEEGLDITGVVQRLRDNLDRDRLTRRFYDDFKRHKDQFQKFIKGIHESGIHAHYTSLMLNRLMFCYFLQQKGFLNGEPDYLRKRLETVPSTLGKNKFHSFYRTFLKRLFFDGLDGEARPPELTALIGDNIPYLNGGIFAEHPIERAHPGIEIPDSAFEKIFDFFDAWQWQLDERPLGNDHEINPEVLGYVFEKYTNQKEMGAYYTKEDITEYISKNTILPFLLQKISPKLPAAAWDLLKNDPDRYIYQAVRHGAGADVKAWKKSLPENIAIGLDGSAGVPPASSAKASGRDAHAPLLERRKHWNTPAPATHALPTEIWRESIARHQRCHELREKLRAGEVKEPADLVTHNLDIRQFVQDVIANAPADLALAMWKSLRSLSVLDPTCGSGAFLFAALEILEPLYEGLLERLRALLADWQAAGEKHPVWEKEIKAILDAVARHPNESYFVHKTIIVHNLYGVDIMEEAVEICKLRLFLKLAAQLEPGQAIEPLPDIDFNVRAGNTLVGYASREEIKRAFTEAGGSGQGLLQGIETSLDDYTRIMEQAEDADRAFKRFQDLQDTTGQNASEFRTAKDALEKRLKALRSQLDRFLAGQYDQKNLKSDATFQNWKNSHEPFHWFVEFYGIMNAGGFDVIVGNPPYVEIRTIKSYKIPFDSFCCKDSGNLYAFCMERGLRFTKQKGMLGMIVPTSVVGLSENSGLRAAFKRLGGRTWMSTYGIRPAKLFDGVDQRLCIYMTNSCVADEFMLQATQFVHWSSDERVHLFSKLRYSTSRNHPRFERFIQTGDPILLKVIEKIEKRAKITCGSLRRRKSNLALQYHRSPRYWIRGMNFEPMFESATRSRSIHHIRDLPVADESALVTIGSVLNSSLFFIWFIAIGNGRNITSEDVDEFPIGVVEQSLLDKMNSSFCSLMEDYQKNSEIKVRKDCRFQEFRPSKSKPLIDQIDTLLAEHYGFTEEELDFIINYDIKYRMGLSGESSGEEAGDA